MQGAQGKETRLRSLRPYGFASKIDLFIMR